MASPVLWNFLHHKLGLKNLADYGRSREKMLGLTNLSISTVFDIGANHGRRAKRYRRKFPDAMIYAVEPIPHMAAGLQKWADKQNGKVSVQNLALANTTGKTDFFVNRETTTWSTLYTPDDVWKDQFDKVEVEVDTLDNLVERVGPVEDDILIKIDTEGADLEVLRGGEKTLSRTAAVIIEAFFYPHETPVFEDILAEMSKHGFAYRGNIRCAWREGVCCGTDALFVKREVTNRLVA